MKTGIELIAAEREEQLTKHGRTIEKDALFNYSYQLTAGAKLLLCLPKVRYENRPDGWSEDIWLRMCNKSYTERLAIAGALIAAEIDRVNFMIENDNFLPE